MGKILINKSMTTKVVAFALSAALAISFVSFTHAQNNLQLSVNVQDACGPVVAKLTIVGGPNDTKQAFTDSNGQYTFTDLFASTFVLDVFADDHESQQITVNLNSNQSLPITLTRTNGSCPSAAPAPHFVNLNFVVRDGCPPNNPVAGAAVHINQDFGNGQDRTTDGNGFANFGVHSNTNIGWAVSASGFSSASGNVNSGEGDTVNVTLNRNCPG